MKSALFLGILCLLASEVAGCSSSASGTYKVSGTVTWNGAPLPEGNIILYPADGTVTPDAGKIIRGLFTFRAKPGKKRVEILASREVPNSFDPVMQSPRREQYIPPCYNAESTLTAEVKADGPNEFTFPLTDQP